MKWVKDPALLQLWHKFRLWLLFDLWPRNSRCSRGAKKRKNVQILNAREGMENRGPPTGRAGMYTGETIKEDSIGFP